MKSPKKIILCVLSFALLFIFTSCSSHIRTGTDDNGYATSKYGTGFKNLEDWDNFRTKQERSKTLNLLEKQIREAVSNKDDSELESLLARRQRLMTDVMIIPLQQNSVKYVDIFLKNNYTETITVLDGDFKGISLDPKGRSKQTKKISTGSITFNVSSVNSRGELGSFPVTRIITENDDSITIKTVTR